MQKDYRAAQLKKFISEVLRVYWTLLKVMVPAIVIVKVLDQFGATDLLAHLLFPVMNLVGLPEELGIVWAVAILTNVYAAMIVFYNLALTMEISIADVSVLGTLILLAHSLPIEGAIAKALGIRWRDTLLIRVGGALVLGVILNTFYTELNYLQQPVQLVWQPSGTATNSIAAWSLEQIQLLISIFFILLALMSLLRLLRYLGIEAILHKLLMPLLRSLTLGKEAANITIIGMTLGISFGAGLLIDEVKKGHISKRDTVLVMGFLGLCHSIIEDTILILLLGADISAILWARLAFAIMVAACWGRFYKSVPAS
ncbi:hypothetical protein [Vibrio sp. SCSIO 43137]|uniref:hypothetical protein n=1 Tax=Vibrio sp. SCSIO 43137 TaxID=3021011 RepID=UPI002306F847|nr:hypothetical protein [Vibrio sp. SCSIO 43137]WCE29613.1 hypothetical protein PK654_15060 [Vibrio sp. SCSIO 43137]